MSFTGWLKSFVVVVLFFHTCVGDSQSEDLQLDQDLFDLISLGRLAMLSPHQKRQLLAGLTRVDELESLHLLGQMREENKLTAPLRKTAKAIKDFTNTVKKAMQPSSIDAVVQGGEFPSATPNSDDTHAHTHTNTHTHARTHAHAHAQREDQFAQLQHADAKLMEEVANIKDDPDCTHREFDMKSFNDNPLTSDNQLLLQEVTHVFAKCGMVVLKNAFPSEEVEAFLHDYSQFMRGLKSGRVSHEGTTTNGEQFYAFELGPKRWDILMPRELARPGMLLSPLVNMFFSQDRVLGEQFVVHSLGSVLGLPQAPTMAWHRDAPQLFRGLFQHSQGRFDISDLPPHSVTMIMPMLNMSREHGPTEFCVGSVNMATFEHRKRQTTDKTPRFVEANSSVYADAAVADELERHTDLLDCPEGYRRAPLTSPGDAVLFDFRVKHRVLENKSNKTRALMYWGFSRQWYKDHNYLTSPGRQFMKPRDAARGRDVDRKIRNRATRLVQEARDTFIKNNGAPEAEFSQDAFGNSFGSETNPQASGVYENVLLNHILKSARFAVPKQVDCDGLVTNVACDHYETLEKTMSENVLDMESILKFAPERKSFFHWYEDIDGDGVVSSRDVKEGETAAGDLDAFAFEKLKDYTDVNGDDEVTWAEVEAHESWKHTHAHNQHDDYPVLIKNGLRKQSIRRALQMEDVGDAPTFEEHPQQTGDRHEL